ncbi:acetyl-CoA carboxylase biotin carboxyl carrier protein [Ferviditalea candida]|uniref:Biotin carboxyl carrier protein of acetyl-CoA carboxylase n=1 Tax=Ferviditalea candida TaxID=3108399 RepID=A0ABU5ZG27_9BACL|nr:acetyl-CoA carboxylase biotin carboxyl carrier protein [Paenibacillaceae bacterium T2]
MFKLSEIKELIKLVDQTSVRELEIDHDGSRLMIRKANTTEPVIINTVPAPAMQPVHTQAYVPETAQVSSPVKEAAFAPAREEQTDDNLHSIVSPMVGTFYEAPSPGAAPFVKVGDKVKEKTVVCIVEAMKLMNEIEAEIKGEIVEVLVENGQLVEFGQPLFRVKRDA